MAEEFVTTSCIRGYHVYGKIWSATIGEKLVCKRQISNVIDRYAVSVVKDDVIVGHLPKKISKICSLFLRRGGSITSEVTGNRRYSADLAKGGLEIPCLLILRGQQKDIETIKKLL